MESRIVRGQAQIITRGKEKSREISFVASTADRDRHGTILNQDGWQLDNFRKNPVIFYNHNHGTVLTPPDPDQVIGRATFVGVEKVNGRRALVVTIEFEPEEINPLAQKIFLKIKFGSLGAVSVGFMEIGAGKYGTGEEARGGKNETYYFQAQELVEISVVNIPSNTQTGKRKVNAETLEMAARSLNVPFEEITKYSPAQVAEMIDKIEAEPLTAADRRALQATAIHKVNILKQNTMKTVSLLDTMKAAVSNGYRWQDHELNRLGVAAMKKAGFAMEPDSYPDRPRQIYIPFESRAQITEGTYGTTPVFPEISFNSSSILAALGATFLTDVRADLTLPVLSGIHSDFADVYDPDANDAANVEKVQFSAKRLGAFLPISIALHQFGGASAEAYLLRIVNAAAGAAVDRAVFGPLAGSASRPQGMAYAHTTGQLTKAPAAAPDSDLMRTMQAAAFDTGIYPGKYAYVASAKAYQKMNIDAGLTPLIDRFGYPPVGPFDVLPFGSISGFPLYVSGNASNACGSDADGAFFAFGNFSRLAVALFGAAALTVDPYTSGKYGIIKLYLDLYLDVRGMDGISATGTTQDNYYKGFSCRSLSQV